MTWTSNMRAIWFLLASVVALGCGPKSSPTNAESTLTNVIGYDSRVDIRSSEAPYKYIGRFDNGCTGFIVADEFVISPLHCFLEEVPSDTNQPNATADRMMFRTNVGYFRPGLIDGKSDYKALPSRIWYATKDPVANRALDWAIVQLNSKLGAKLGGALALANYNVAMRLPFETRLTGYSGDAIVVDEDNHLKPLPNGGQRRLGFTPSEDPGCTLLQANEERNLLLHGCDVTGGGSGAPAFNKVANGYEVVAIHVADFKGEGETSYKDELVLPNDRLGRKANAGFAVPVENFSSKFQEVLRLYKSAKAIKWGDIGLDMHEVMHVRANLKDELEVPSFESAFKPYKLGVDIDRKPVKLGAVQGLRIRGFYEASPARAAGLLVDDVIASINNEPMNTYEELVKVMSRSRGRAVVVFWRGNKQFSLSVQATLDELVPEPKVVEEKKPVVNEPVVEEARGRWVAIGYGPSVVGGVSIPNFVGLQGDNDAIGAQAQAQCGAFCGFATAVDGCIMAAAGPRSGTSFHWIGFSISYATASGNRDLASRRLSGLVAAQCAQVGGCFASKLVCSD